MPSCMLGAGGKIESKTPCHFGTSSLVLKEDNAYI